MGRAKWTQWMAEEVHGRGNSSIEISSVCGCTGRGIPRLVTEKEAEVDVSCACGKAHGE